MKKIIILLIVTVMFSACSKKVLDFSSDKYFGIKELIKSKNCDSDCDEQASCEGEIVKLEGVLDESNVNFDQSQFWLIDSHNQSISIMVDVSQEMKVDIFKKLKGKKNKLIKVKGKIKGFAAHYNFNCDRKFYIILIDM